MFVSTKVSQGPSLASLQAINAMRNRIRVAAAAGGDVEYMRYRLAYKKAALLANDMLMESTERVGTIRRFVMGRTLKWRSRDPDAPLCFRASGPAGGVSKMARKHRLKRGLAELRKEFSPATSGRFRRYLLRSLPTARAWRERDGWSETLDPPAREGETAFGLFSWVPDPSAFRRAVEAVTRCNSNQVRGAVVDELIRNCGPGTVPVQAVMFFSGKTKEVHNKHYTALATPEFENMRRSTLPFAPR